MLLLSTLYSNQRYMFPLFLTTVLLSCFCSNKDGSTCSKTKDAQSIYYYAVFASR